MSFVMVMDKDQPVDDVQHDAFYLRRSFGDCRIDKVRYLGNQLRGPPTIDICIQVQVAQLHVNEVKYRIRKTPKIKNSHNVFVVPAFAQLDRSTNFVVNVVLRYIAHRAHQLSCKCLNSHQLVKEI
jgi:hypothetical protein